MVAATAGQYRCLSIVVPEMIRPATLSVTGTPLVIAISWKEPSGTLGLSVFGRFEGLEFSVIAGRFAPFRVVEFVVGIFHLALLLPRPGARSLMGLTSEQAMAAVGRPAARSWPVSDEGPARRSCVLARLPGIMSRWPTIDPISTKP